MKNSIGNPARGEAFYPRVKQVSKIYRVLKTGVSIYLSAPRRVGKTSILRHIEEAPEKGHYFVYVITEAIDESNEFFKVIFEAVLGSDALKNMSKISRIVLEGVESMISRVKKIYGVELQDRKVPDYFELLRELLNKTKEDVGSLIIQIDEFPTTIQNIMNKSGAKEAEKFILQNRELRHHDQVDAVQFIYTGSLSLYPIVEQITELTAVNDMRTVEVGPLSDEEGVDFLQQLLIEEGIQLDMPVITHILERLKWLIPFHVQLIAQELIDVFEAKGEPLTIADADAAFNQVVHVRNKAQFAPYFTRLSKLFNGNRYEFVMDLLNHAAINNSIDENEINNYAVKHAITDQENIKNILDGDGYLYFSQEAEYYHYTSPLLQMWFKKHIAVKRK